MLAATAATALAFALCVDAYIPAVPTNNTNAVNQTDMSMLTMKWAPAGTYSNTVSYQLASMDSNGFEQVRHPDRYGTMDSVGSYFRTTLGRPCSFL